MRDARTLLTPDGFGGVVATVRDNNPDLPDATARRIVVEALKFVAAAAQFPTVKITPSNVVDEGWHALILHTDLYKKLCDRLGRFVHHWPERPDGYGLGRRGRELLPHPQARRVRTDQPRQLRFPLLRRQRGG